MKNIERMFYVLLIAGFSVFMLQYHFDLFIEILKWTAIGIGVFILIILLGL